MNTNFSILDSVGLQAQDNYCDLHNNFYLGVLTVVLKNKIVLLQFERSHDTGPSADVDRIVLKFVEVDYMQVSSGVFSSMIRDIHEIGYKKPDDFDYNWLMSGTEINAEDHLVFRLTDDEIIRVHSFAANATLIPRQRI